jgi:hypothetical protein
MSAGMPSSAIECAFADTAGASRMPPNHAEGGRIAKIFRRDPRFRIMQLLGYRLAANSWFNLRCRVTSLADALPLRIRWSTPVSSSAANLPSAARYRVCSISA